MERAGRYLLIDEIGSGGMATVHLGRLVGPAGFGRTVAIKRLHPHHRQDPDLVAMLLDEARLACRIYHPNVVQVLDVITEGSLLLVLEYVHGESLARIVKRVRARGERIEPAIAVAVIVGVLRGLHAAHEMTGEGGASLDLVHRDVSPHNVLVTTDGTSKILDFGIAKAQGRIQTTRDGQLKGKLAYMSPEQLENRALDRRADVHAASVVLWELLTGERLFLADTDGATIANVLRGAIPLPSTIAEVPGDLEAIVMRGLAPDRADRYPTAWAMADAIEACMAPAPSAQVAAWVLREWPEADARARRLAEIERLKTSGAVRDGARLGAGDAGDEEETESAIVAGIEETASAVVVATGTADTDDDPLREDEARSPVGDEMTIRVAPTLEPLKPATPPAPTRSWKGWAASALGATALVVAWRFGAVSTPVVALDGGVATSAAGVSAPSAATTTVSAPSASPSASTPSASASTPASGRAVAGSVARAPAAAPASVAPGRRPAATASAPSCDPPWTLDEAGNHQWKRECFR